MFCISGVLSDIYCTPDLRILSFEELLNQRLHELGYKSVVFYSGAKNQFFAMDRMGRDGFAYFNKNKKPAQPVPAEKAAPTVTENATVTEEKPKTSGVAGFSRNRTNRPAANTSTSNAVNERPSDKSGSYRQSIKDESVAADCINSYMCDCSVPKVMVFTSLEDFVNNVDRNRRKFYAYFEDWKSLPNENRNICIFLSKSIDHSNLQHIFDNQNTLALRSLFIKGANSGAAEFNHNSCIIVGSPLNDEIGNLLEYLRIKGHSYITRDANNNDVLRTAKLSFSGRDKEAVIRALSFFNRDAEYSELKNMKEAIEDYMEKQQTERVLISVDTVSEIYNQNGRRYRDDEDPLEILRTKKGWESAYNVINSFIVSHRNRYAGRELPEKHYAKSEIERVEADKTEMNAYGPVPNFVLQGPPGVGKTEIANLIGRILQREGILKSGHTVIGSRDKLVGQYVGSTAIITASMIEQAQEGILLIDEVYSLAEETSNGPNYCAEVFSTLVAAMTNKNYHFCVIFAGYASRMDEVWRMNEGLFSRFGEANIINIEEYQPELLQTIFENKFSENDDEAAVLSEDVINGLPQFFQNYFDDRDRNNFGNARDINQLSEAVKRRAGYRHIRDGEKGIVTVKREDFGDKISLFEKRVMTADDIYAKLGDYIGLDFLVDLFNDQLAIKIECAEKGLDYPGPAHMIWCGNPGTGKSTAAQLTAELYHSMGILGGSKPVYVDASELTQNTVGSSAKAVNAKMDEACRFNTILVIEEAYQLAESVMGTEVINAMLNRMETDRKKFNVIFVLYSDRKQQFLDVNPGLQSRLLCYEFKDYDSEQLMSIFMKMCEKSKDTVSDDAKNEVASLLDYLYRNGSTRDGNARIVRKLLEVMRQNRYRRVLGEMAVSIYGEDTPVNRGKVSAARAIGSVKVPENAYVFVSSDIPSDFAESLKKQ